MPKYENPTKGFIACPVCNTAASVHACGEGQLLATGEPPKNSRNLGLHYYRCPQCGNSPISKSINDFVTGNMSETETEIKPNQTDYLDDSTEIETVESTPVTEPITEQVTESKDLIPKKTKQNWWKTKTAKYAITGLVAVFVVFWVGRQLMPKKPKGVVHG